KKLIALSNGCGEKERRNGMQTTDSKLSTVARGFCFPEIFPCVIAQTYAIVVFTATPGSNAIAARILHKNLVGIDLRNQWSERCIWSVCVRQFRCRCNALLMIEVIELGNVCLCRFCQCNVTLVQRECSRQLLSLMQILFEYTFSKTNLVVELCLAR